MAIFPGKIFLYNNEGDYRLFDPETDTWEPATAPWYGGYPGYTSDGIIRARANPGGELLLIAGYSGRLHYIHPVTKSLTNVLPYLYGKDYAILGIGDDPVTGKPTAYVGADSSVTVPDYHRIELNADFSVSSTIETATGWSTGRGNFAQWRHENCFSPDGFFTLMSTTGPPYGEIFRRDPATGLWSNFSGGTLFRPDGITPDTVFRSWISFGEDSIMCLGRHLASTYWNGSTWTNYPGTWWWIDQSGILSNVAFDEDNIFALYDSGGSAVVAHFSTSSGIVRTQTFPSLDGNYRRILCRSKTEYYITSASRNTGDGEGLWRLDTSSVPWTLTNLADPPNNFLYNGLSPTMSITGWWAEINRSTVSLTGVDPTLVSEAGGEEITITGSFPVGGDLSIHLGPLGTAGDPLCYSGVPGQGYTVQSSDGTTIQVITPQGTVGAASITVAYNDEPLVTLAGINVVERHWPPVVFNMRRNHPPLLDVGNRGIESEELE